MKTIKEKEHTINIDFEIFTTDEIIKIYRFYALIEKHASHPQKTDVILKAYNEYRNIINSIALEKKYDQSFYQATKISIYQTVNNLKH